MEQDEAVGATFPLEAVEDSIERFLRDFLACKPISEPELGLMAAALLPTTLLAAPKSIDKVNGAIRTEAGTEYGSLETVNGSIRVASPRSRKV